MRSSQERACYHGLSSAVTIKALAFLWSGDRWQEETSLELKGLRDGPSFTGLSEQAGLLDDLSCVRYFLRGEPRPRASEYRQTPTRLPCSATAAKRPAKHSMPSSASPSVAAQPFRMPHLHPEREAHGSDATTRLSQRVTGLFPDAAEDVLSDCGKICKPVYWDADAPSARRYASAEWPL